MIPKGTSKARRRRPCSRSLTGRWEVLLRAFRSASRVVEESELTFFFPFVKPFFLFCVLDVRNGVLGVSSALECSRARGWPASVGLLAQSRIGVASFDQYVFLTGGLLDWVFLP